MAGHKVLIINRGLPGSGKSTWIDILSNNPTVISFDNYRRFDSGVYEYRPSKEGEVRAKAETDFLQAIKRKDEIIVIDNTNIKKIDVEFFGNIGLKNVYDVIIFSFLAGETEEHWKRQTHDIPLDVIAGMKKNYKENIEIPLMHNYVVDNSIDEIRKILRRFNIQFKKENGKLSGISQDKHTIDERAFIVASLIMQGASTMFIKEYVKTKTKWGVTDRTVDNYIRKARELITSSQSFDMLDMKAENSEKLDDLYRKSYRLQDYKTCMNLLREKNLLWGLYPNNNNGRVEEASLADIAKAIRETDG